MAGETVESYGSVRETLNEIAKMLNVSINTDGLAMLRAIKERVKELTTTKDVEIEDGSEDAEVAASVRRVLGLSADAGCAEVVLAMKTRGSSELAGLRSREAERDVKDIIAPYVQANKLNPNDHVAMEAAVHLAKTDPARLRALMDRATPYVQPGRTVSPGGTTAHRTDVIRRARTKHESEKDLQNTCSVEAYVNDALRDEKLLLLTDSETTALAF